MYSGNIWLKETNDDDLDNLLGLWNNPEVMKYVGLPNGICWDKNDIKKWYIQYKKEGKFIHYSIYTDELGYCGETGYSETEDDVIKHKNFGLEIKLLPKTQGKGIAEWTLRKIIDMAIKSKKIDSVWTTPHRDNINAKKLYLKLGLKKKEFPEYLSEYNNGYCDYMELKLCEYKNPE